jgi:OFA family oxalate/formate antiporter-like MFS transporter
MQARRFDGWWVVGAATVGLGCGIATMVAATFGVFLTPVRTELGWSQSDAFSALLAVTITAAMLAPLVGGIVDRYGARRVAIFSFIAEILILASFSRQGPEIWTFYARYFLLAVLALGTTHVAFARVITLWFDRRRGLALGIALSGIGLGGFLWPLYVQATIERFGWRTAYLLLAVAIAVIALPAMLLLLKDSPESVGQRPDGDPPEPTPAEGLPAGGSGIAAGSAARAAHGIPFGQALRSGAFWLVMITFFLIGFAVQSVMMHLVPMLTSRGVSPMIAALAQSSVFVAVTTARLVTGWLMDRFFAPRVALAFLVAPIVGIGLLAAGADGAIAFAAAMLIGLAAGAEVDVLAYLTGRYFGPLHFSRIYGSYYGIYSLSGGIGPVVTAMVVDSGGGYPLALAGHCVLLVVAGVLLLRFPGFPPPARLPRPA